MLKKKPLWNAQKLLKLWEKLQKWRFWEELRNGEKWLRRYVVLLGFVDGFSLLKGLDFRGCFWSRWNDKIFCIFFPLNVRNVWCPLPTSLFIPNIRIIFIWNCSYHRWYTPFFFLAKGSVTLFFGVIFSWFGLNDV